MTYPDKNPPLLYLGHFHETWYTVTYDYPSKTEKDSYLEIDL